MPTTSPGVNANDGVPGTGCSGVSCATGIAPGVGSGAALPYTGIGDVLGALLLAAVMGIAGFLAWRWAMTRESIEEAAARSGRTPARSLPRRTGYAQALRDYDIERRARRVFAPRVA